MSFTALFVATSLAAGLPEGLLEAVCYVESTHRPNVIHHHDGAGDSYGLCQIKLSTAKQMGFEGTWQELMQPKTNIKYAGKYLAHQIKRYNGDYTKGVCAYNRGSCRTDGRNEYTRKVYTRYFDQANKRRVADSRRSH